MPKFTERHVQILELLVALNDWEDREIHQLGTLSGRTLYFQMAKSLLQARGPYDGDSLKQCMGNLSDRSLRERMRHFEACNLLNREPGDVDARTRKLVPTEQFEFLLEQHLDHCQKSLESRFYLVNKF